MTGADGTPALVVTGATKSYGDQVALDGVDLVADREIVGVFGINGAGKSTLFRSLLDLVRLDGGSIEILGRDPRREGVEVRRRVGYLPEEPDLPQRLSADELLDFAAFARSGAADGREVAERLGLGAPLRRRWVRELSLGMRKKLALACALLGSPPLLVLDEPLNGLDAPAMRDLRLELRRRVEIEGTTVVLSSHVLSFLERICDRIVVLRSGRVVADAAPRELGRGAELETSLLELAGAGRSAIEASSDSRGGA